MQKTDDTYAGTAKDKGRILIRSIIFRLLYLGQPGDCGFSMNEKFKARNVKRAGYNAEYYRNYKCSGTPDFNGRFKTFSVTGFPKWKKFFNDGLMR